MHGAGRAAASRESAGCAQRSDTRLSGVRACAVAGSARMPSTRLPGARSSPSFSPENADRARLRRPGVARGDHMRRLGADRCAPPFRRRLLGRIPHARRRDARPAVPPRSKMPVVNDPNHPVASSSLKPQVSKRTNMPVVNDSFTTGISVRTNRSQRPFWCASAALGCRQGRTPPKGIFDSAVHAARRARQ